jgi:phosphoglycerate dehydrogenase-like enzyme
LPASKGARLINIARGEVVDEPAFSANFAHWLRGEPMFRK